MLVYSIVFALNTYLGDLILILSFFFNLNLQITKAFLTYLKRKLGVLQSWRTLWEIPLTVM